MSGVIDGLDTDNPPSVGEITARPALPDGNPAHRTSAYVLDTENGHGWHAYNSPAWPVWTYAGGDPAMSLYQCCVNLLTLTVDTLYEFWH